MIITNIERTDDLLKITVEGQADLILLSLDSLKDVEDFKLHLKQKVGLLEKANAKYSEIKKLEGETIA